MENEQIDSTTMSNEKVRQFILDLKKIQKVRGLKVPIKTTNNYHKKLKQLNLMYEPVNVQKIVNYKDGKEFKIIFMSEDSTQQKLALTEEEKAQVEIVERQVTLTFENISNQQIFEMFQQMGKKDNKEVIPFPNSFETAGHIAHYNLTEDQAKYLHIIGQITLMKCFNIKTVANKSEKLHNVYRTPTLIHMAGQKNNYQVSMKEVGTLFEFDFEKVYWCSRLQKQRDRLLDLMKSGQCLADIFCGVGPLAVRAARKGLYVIANDLNPYCHEYLIKNAKKNGVQQKMICWNMCAREAARRIYKEHNQFEKPFRAPDHIYMNLPVDAIQFLDVLKDYQKYMEVEKMPLVHVNCFVVADSDEKSQQLLSQRISKVLPGFKKQDITIMHHIKNVTVIMRMYCLTFRLSKNYQGYQQNQDKKQIEDDVQLLDKVEKKRKLQ